MTTEPNNKHNQKSLADAILKTWPRSLHRPRYITGFQVRDAAGFSAWRTIDAVVLDTWPSKGLTLHALEIKVSMSDLRRELDDPAKSSQFEEIVDRFSIVAPLGVVDLDLLPKHWGLYCPTPEGTLRARRKPLPIRPGKPNKTINRSFAAAFVRAVVDRDLDRNLLDEQFTKGIKAGEERSAHRAEVATKDLERYMNAVETFEEKSGVRISTYNGGSIGEAVKFVLDGGILRQINRSHNIRDLGNRLIAMADELEALSANIDKPTRAESDLRLLVACIERGDFSAAELAVQAMKRAVRAEVIKIIDKETILRPSPMTGSEL